MNDSQRNITSQLAYRGRCYDSEHAYLAIVITILPQWAIITTLIVFMLIAFHNSLKAAIVYENCSKANALYKYYVEIRTGDTSAAYNRRRTTLFIDMFDDNQSTLSRVTIPGHVIFGKKDAPISAIEDGKYYELRVTRFWLYRAFKLRKVSTIRITHTCTDSDARIMVYGLEIRTSDPERHKLFFPVMSNISAYGSVNRQNVSFDLESTGSISNFGGPHHEGSSISNQLSWIDLTILTYFLSSLVFYLTRIDLVESSFLDFPHCLGKGALVGLIGYVVTVMIGSLLRYYVKQRYSDWIGLGYWAVLYYASGTLILVVASGFWIYTTVSTYKELCPKLFGMWVLSIVVALGECAVFALINSLAHWAISLCLVRTADQYILPDEINSAQEPPSRGRTNSQSKQLMGHTSSPQTGWHSIASPMPMPVMLPSGGYVHPNIYAQPLVIQSPVSAHTYKAVQAAYPTTGYDAHPLVNATQSPAPIGYHQQTNEVNLQGIKATKKIGSNESTGSTYYQQLMKNKGGVKSISQYGELLKQKKLSNKGAKK